MQCTLRLSFFARVVIYMILPLIAVLIPLSFVYCISCTTPLLRKITARRRNAERVGKQVSKCHQCVYSIVSLVSGDDMVKRAARQRERRRALAAPSEDDTNVLNVEIDTLLDELLNAEAALALAELRSDQSEPGGVNEGGAETIDAEGASRRSASMTLYGVIRAIDAVGDGVTDDDETSTETSGAAALRITERGAGGASGASVEVNAEL